jgi:hypothetical protein
MARMCPDYGPYADKDWPKQDKGQAAMITRLDSYVGRMMEHLQKTRPRGEHARHFHQRQRPAQREQA